jgi:hypothetical protein
MNVPESSSQLTFDPVAIATELSAKLASKSRHVSLLLGAGASTTAGLPNLAGMSQVVLESLPSQHREMATALMEERNLEQSLTRLRRIAAIANSDERVGEFTGASAAELDRALCAAIVSVVANPSGPTDAFRSLGVWAAGARYSLPVEIFTINYDNLIEIGLEAEGVAYFDGFVGSLLAPFREDLVEASGSPDSQSLPASFVRLWKLHGSINWEFREAEGARSVVRLGAPVASGKAAAIYPSDEKYDDSRRVPFVVLMDRFRHALATPESSTIVCGYSFSDQHLNDLLFDAAKRFPRSEIVALCFSKIPEELAERALLYRNILVLSRSEAIIGGVRGLWRSDSSATGISKSGAFVLVDFRNMAKYLARNRSTEAGAASA